MPAAMACAVDTDMHLSRSTSIHGMSSPEQKVQRTQLILTILQREGRRSVCIRDLYQAQSETKTIRFGYRWDIPFGTNQIAHCNCKARMFISIFVYLVDTGSEGPSLSSRLEIGLHNNSLA